jgi:hypothetical protein
MELGEIEGVKSVKADMKTKMVHVSFEKPADEEILIATLKEINYPPSLE